MYSRNQKYSTTRRRLRLQVNLEKIFKLGVLAFVAITVLVMWSTSKAPVLNAAYVTMADSDDYADGAIALANSLRHVQSVYPLWVLTTGGISTQKLDRLAKIPGLKVVNVEKLSLPSKLEAKEPRWINAFTKLRAFELNLERVVWIDSDAIVTANVDELFHNPGGPSVLYAGIDPNIVKCDQVFPRGEAPLNSGIMVIRPSQAAFQRLMNGLETLAGSGLTYLNDQDVLAYTFRYWKKLPYPDFGGHVIHCNCTGFYESIKVLHFTAGLTPLQKPWMKDFDLGKYEKMSCVRRLYRTWSSMYYL